MVLEGVRHGQAHGIQLAIAQSFSSADDCIIEGLMLLSKQGTAVGSSILQIHVALQPSSSIMLSELIEFCRSSALFRVTPALAACCLAAACQS